MKKLNLIGKRYARLLVLSEAPKRGAQTCWVCQCDCGNQTVVRTANLRRGHTTSCGCAWKQTVWLATKTHGKSRTKEHRAWKEMKRRCYSPSDSSYTSYGGRGIKVCERWLDSFKAFFEDMGLAPSSQHSLDRKNVNGDYEPNNCRWATPLEQANNKRASLKLVYNGKVYSSLAVLAREIGVTPASLRYFHRRRGLKIELAVDKARSTAE